MPDTTLGNLLISSEGETASLTQNGLPATALLIVTLANFFTSEDRQNSHPNVKLLNKNVAQIDYDYKDEKEAIQLTVHWDQKSDPHLDFYTFHWKKPANLHILQDGISLTTNPHQFWYGGVNLMDLRWPIAPSSGYELSLFGTNDVHLGDSIKLGDQSTFWYGGFHSMDLEWPMAKKNSEMSEFVLNDIYHDSMKLGEENDQTHWYGGSNLMNLEWPMRKNSYKMSEFVLNDIYQFTGTSGQERYWLSSKKVAINVPWNVPLWTAVQKGQLELQSRLVDSQFLLMNDHLEYTLAVAKNENMTLKDFHQQCFRKFLKAPTAYPDLAIMEKPIWSTWASFWTGVNRTQVEEYAEQIKANGMPISQLELDDMWTTTYGDYQINAEKFPDFKGMVKKLKENYGVPRMTAWVHPFVNAESENGKNEELRNKIFIKDKNGDVPLSWWWDCPPKAKDPSKPIDENNPDLKVPCAYVIDLTNPDARDWWFGELKRMQDEGIYTFKFDAGETNWFPKNYTLHSGNNPNNFGQDYAYFSAQFGPAVENRYGSGSQQANIFMRTMDRNSYWDKEGGLFTLIPWALQSSLHGYFWNLPDMIGGNGLNHTHENIKGDPPEAQLYIRWTQANAFLLAMQFSYPPWHPNYSPEVLKTVKKVMDLRAKWMPYILKCVKNAVKDQEPVIRPMWWESDAQDALASRDQYMVGKDMVVAPVVEKDKYERNVYLPPGTWKDGNKENVEYAGDKTYSYQAPIDIVPFFVRVGTSPNAAFPSMAASILASILPLLVASIILLNFNGN